MREDQIQINTEQRARAHTQHIPNACPVPRPVRQHTRLAFGYPLVQACSPYTRTECAGVGNGGGVVVVLFNSLLVLFSVRFVLLLWTWTETHCVMDTFVAAIYLYMFGAGTNINAVFRYSRYAILVHVRMYIHV